MDSLEGLVERITYYNAENGYTVLRLTARGYPDLVTVVGTLPEITPGESLRLQGQWISNAQYGKQFKAVICQGILIQLLSASSSTNCRQGDPPLVGKQLHPLSARCTT